MILLPMLYSNTESMLMISHCKKTLAVMIRGIYKLIRNNSQTEHQTIYSIQNAKKCQALEVKFSNASPHQADLVSDLTSLKYGTAFKRKFEETCVKIVSKFWKS